jgi:hypothetical protein
MCYSNTRRGDPMGLRVASRAVPAAIGAGGAALDLSEEDIFSALGALGGPVSAGVSMALSSGAAQAGELPDSEKARKGFVNFVEKVSREGIRVDKKNVKRLAKESFLGAGLDEKKAKAAASRWEQLAKQFGQNMDDIDVDAVSARILEETDIFSGIGIKPNPRFSQVEMPMYNTLDQAPIEKRTPTEAVDFGEQIKEAGPPTTKPDPYTGAEDDILSSADKRVAKEEAEKLAKEGAEEAKGLKRFIPKNKYVRGGLTGAGLAAAIYFGSKLLGKPVPTGSEVPFEDLKPIDTGKLPSLPPQRGLELDNSLRQIDQRIREREQQLRRNRRR